MTRTLYIPTLNLPTFTGVLLFIGLILGDPPTIWFKLPKFIDLEDDCDNCLGDNEKEGDGVTRARLLKVIALVEVVGR